jgi:transcriptional regulator with XRE-family HTH domain
VEPIDAFVKGSATETRHRDPAAGAGAKVSSIAEAENYEFGQNLRRLRMSRRLTLRELGDRASCSAAFLSMIEQGQVSPSLKNIGRICRAVGTTLSDFCRGEKAVTKPLIVRHSDRRKGRIIRRENASVIREILPNEVGSEFTLLFTSIEPGGSTLSSGFRGHRPEVLIVLKGRPTFISCEERTQLSVGDIIYFDLSQHLSIINETMSVVELIAMNPYKLARIEELVGRDPKANGYGAATVNG